MPVIKYSSPLKYFFSLTYLLSGPLQKKSATLGLVDVYMSDVVLNEAVT